MKGMLDLNDKHNFAGYIEYSSNQYFCTITDYIVKMFYKESPINHDEYDAEDNKEEYIFGFDEKDCPFSVLAVNLKTDIFASRIPYHFSTPVVIRGKQRLTDLSYFDGIEFFGETVNKVFDPRQAVEHSKFSTKVEDMMLKFRPDSDYSKNFGIDINGQKAEIGYSIYRSFNLAEQRNEDGSISLGALNSSIRIKFENSQSLEMLKRYYVVFSNFLIFLTGRQNVDFGVKIFQKNNNDLYFHTADCFFQKNNSDTYNGKMLNTIQANSLGDTLPELFTMFTNEKTAPFLRYLPENNKMANYITAADVLNICTAFEIAYGLDETDKKDNIVQNMKIPEFGKSILSRRMWFLFEKATNTTSEEALLQNKKSVASFVMLRDDIIHNGNMVWGDSGRFAMTLIKILYVNIFLRAKMDKEKAIRIADTKWRT